MHRTHERRDDHEKRVPLRAAVELSEGAPDDAFEADAVNLSRGGMLLRSACLPDPGARLRCSFEHPESGALIEAEGEVVWAQLEGESGEIGLAFTDLDPRTELLIEQIIAGSAPPSQPPEEPSAPGEKPSTQRAPQLYAQSRARVTNLSLEGISEPLETQVTELGVDRAVFEQVLPLLKLGRAVQADAPELAGRRGAIASVELRMVGHVPTLAVTVSFDRKAVLTTPKQPERDPEFHFTSTDVPAELLGEDPSHDTEPDLASPDSISSAGQDAIERDLSAHNATTVNAGIAPGSTTATEFRANKPFERSHPPRQLALQAISASAPRMSKQPEIEREEPLPAALASQVGQELAPPVARPVAQRVVNPVVQPVVQGKPAEAPIKKSISEPTSVFPLGGQFDEQDDSDFEDALQGRSPAWKPIAMEALRKAHRASVRIAGQVMRLSLVSKAAALPHVRLAFVRMRAVLRHVARGVGPQLGAARRLIAVQLGKKRRRTTAGGSPEAAARQASSEKGGSLGRTLAIGVLTTAAAGLGVYALIPATEPEAALHRAVDLSEAVPAVPDMTFEPEGAPAPAPVVPTPAMPSAASVPKGSPFAVDVREGKSARAPVVAPAIAAPAPAIDKPAPRGMRFGAANPPSRAQRFTLRMSKPIEGIEGIADAGGFTIIVSGSLSLDRAGPISASHAAVARAMVLNKGDRAVLTIRFVDGKRPAYQVRADGSTLYLIIEEV